MTRQKQRSSLYTLIEHIRIPGREFNLRSLFKFGLRFEFRQEPLNNFKLWRQFVYDLVYTIDNIDI